MHLPVHRRHRGAVSILAALVVAVTACEAGAQSALAGPGVIVANDGRTFPPASLTLLESLPFRGTGVLPESARTKLVTPPSGLPPMERGAATESVIGTDERHQVTDTTVFPYRAIVSLVMTFPGGDFTCTGFFIDADTIATAGHCVYDSFAGGWATSITAYPGRNGDTFPYGSATSTTFFAPQDWIDTEDHTVDYGAIKLPSPLGETTGWLGYGVKLDQNLVRANARLVGYPGDKPNGTMWGTRRGIKGVATDKIFYKIDTFGGQSGSPVYGRVSNVCQPCAFGIHAYGTGIEPFPESNSGTRVTDDVFANLVFWASQ